MKIIDKIVLQGSIASFREPLKEIEEAIEQSKIIIPPIEKGNGVKPIKIESIQHLKNNGWIPEHKMNLEGMKAKPLDAHKSFGKTRVGFEWETGNISSSFRALMKLYKAVIEAQIDFGVHVIPSRAFYKYLTDRIGNIRELEPYLDIYKRIKLPSNACILIIVIEHDKLDPKAPPIPKGLDGMAKKPKKKKETKKKAKLK